MAARRVIGGPPAEPRDLAPGQIFPLAVAPGLGERPLERPAVDRVSHQRGHDAGAIPARFADDVNGPVATIADEREELLGIAVLRLVAPLEGQQEDVLETEPRVVDVVPDAEADHGLDTPSPQPRPSLLASRLPRPREPVLPDHPVVRDGLARGCFRTLPAGPCRWPTREGERGRACNQHERDQAPLARTRLEAGRAEPLLGHPSNVIGPSSKSRNPAERRPQIPV